MSYSYSQYDIHNLSADVTHTTNDKGYHRYILGMTVGRVQLIEQSDHWFISHIDSDLFRANFSSLRAALQAAEMVNESKSPSETVSEYDLYMDAHIR